jgi:hypothetical protein
LIFLRSHHVNSGTTWGIRVELQQRVLPHGKMTLKLGTLDQSRCMRGVNPNPYQDAASSDSKESAVFFHRQEAVGGIDLCLCLRRIPCCYLSLIYETCIGLAKVEYDDHLSHS